MMNAIKRFSITFLPTFLLILSHTDVGGATMNCCLGESSTKQGNGQELLSTNKLDSSVQVIVELNLPSPGFKPEGSLSHEEVQRQRAVIASIRNALLKNLNGQNVVVYREYESVPYVAMKVNSEVLKLLRKSHYVNSIQKDTPEESN